METAIVAYIVVALSIVSGYSGFSSMEAGEALAILLWPIVAAYSIGKYLVVAVYQVLVHNEHE